MAEWRSKGYYNWISLAHFIILYILANILNSMFSLVTYAHQPANLGRSMTLGLYPL